MSNGNGHRSTRELIQEIIGDIQEIIRSELRLARTEIKEEGAKAGVAAGMFGGVAVLGLMALALFEGMCVVLWAMLTPLWIAFLIMSLISAFTAGILCFVAIDRWHKVHPVPEKTMTTLKEDLEWARSQTR